MAKSKEKKTYKNHTDEEKIKILNDIIIQIKLENKSVRGVFSDDNESKPEINRDTFYEWLKQFTEISDQYARACEDRAESIFEEILNITDKAMIDMVEVQQARLKVDARKWMLGKMMPKKYGDKIDISADVNSNINTTQTIDLSSVPTSVLQELLKHSQKNE